MAIDCGSQIILCDLPIRYDTYTGCSHACAYCFVKKKRNISQIAVDASLDTLKKFIKGERTQQTRWCDWNIPLHWGGASDPFQPLEKKARASYRALQIFAESKYPFVVSTKGKLIADDEYLALLDKCNCVVQISAACGEYDKLEKGAPTFDERVEIMRKVAPHCKRLIVRIQPYVVECHNSIMQSLQRFKDAGVYGVTVEGMKFQRAVKGMKKCAGDVVYPIEILRSRFSEIKEECHRLGLAFFCAENRLRSMGDDLCCCGIAGLDGFTTNKFNYNHIFNGDFEKPTENMKQKGTAQLFSALFQNAGIAAVLRNRSFVEAMLSNDTRRCASKVFGRVRK